MNNSGRMTARLSAITTVLLVLAQFLSVVKDFNQDNRLDNLENRVNRIESQLELYK